MSPGNPVAKTYAALDQAFDFFNDRIAIFMPRRSRARAWSAVCAMVTEDGDDGYPLVSVNIIT